MSEENTNDWAREFGCEVVSVPRATKLVMMNCLLGGKPLILIGDTGQGKSDAVFTGYDMLRKIARNGDFNMQLARSPGNPILREHYVAARLAREKNEQDSSSFDFTFDQWVPATSDAFDYRGLPFICQETNRQKYSRPDMIPDDFVAGQGVINVREMNRPAAARTVKPLIEMMESRMLGEHVIPEGYRIIGDLNVGAIYDIHDILTPFFIRRVKWVFVRNTLEDWATFMERKYGTSLVVDFLIDNPDLFDNHQGRVENHIYACAAVWEDVHCELARAQGQFQVADMRELVSGMVGRDVGARFVEFCSRGLELSPRLILNDYKKVRKQVLKLIDEGSGGDIVASAALATIKTLKGYDPDDKDTDKALENFARFFCDIPLEVAQNTAIELAPPASKFNETGRAEVQDPETGARMRMVQKIHHQLMLGNRESRERLSQLNAIISKRSGPAGS